MFWPVAIALTVAGPSVALTATVGKLGAGNFGVRETAARELLTAGERAVAPLTVAARSADPEVRRRAAELLDRLADRRAWTATEVTVHADCRPLNDVLAELAAAGGCPIRYGLDAPPVTAHLDRVPFWRALDSVCAAAGLVPDPNDDRGMHLHRWPTPPHVCYTGPYRLTVTAASGGWVADLSGQKDVPPPVERVQLNLRLVAEPKTPVVAVGKGTVLEAEDDGGRSMRPPDARPSYYLPWFHRSHAHTFSADLVRPDKTARAIRRLRGTVTVTALTGVIPDAVLADPLGAVGRTARGRTADLTLDAVSATQGLLALTVTVSRPSGDSRHDDGAAGLEQRLVLTDADGRATGPVETANRTTTPGGVRVTVRFSNPVGGRPAALTLMQWRTVTRDMAFEFKDIPLP